MADGRKYRYDEGGWQTYKFVCPLIHSNTLEKSLKDIIAKGEIKFTIRHHQDTTSEIWVDTTYSRKNLEDATRDIPNIKLTKQ